MLGHIRDDLKAVGPNEGKKKCLTPEKQILMWLWYLANKTSYRLVARLFGVSKSTAHKYIHKVSNIVCNLSRNVIRWPTLAEQDEIAADIERSSHIPNCIGFIDGSHIRLESRPDGDNDYTNRKGFPSIQLQAIVDNKTIITDMFVGWPGSVHDARVFRNSPIADAMENGNIMGANKFIFGDSAYPLQSFLLTPFRNTGHLTENEKFFNRTTSSARQAVERTFGLIKGRFRQLRCLETTNVAHACQLITSACILHNLCVISGDDAADFIEEDADYNNDPNNYPPVYINANDGIAIRNGLVQHLAQFR